MLNKIKREVRTHFRDSLHSGVLLFSGSFSRNEISVVDSVLVSDMELLYIYKENTDFRKLRKSIKTLEVYLKKNNIGILNNFQIELEGVHFKELNANRNNLLVHQFESLKNYDVIIENPNICSELSDLKVDKSSVYDILLHRILNQLSLVYNFENNQLNDVFYNRSWKNISDFLTYNYLNNYCNSQKWIVKKLDRNKKLVKTKEFKCQGLIQFNLSKPQNITFIEWKSVFIIWINHYNETNYKITQTKANSKSKFAIIYSYLINISLKLFRKKELSIRELLNKFEFALINSNSFVEFNRNIKSELLKFGYSKRTYIFLNGSYFMYWIRHYKYYKSVK